MSDYSNETYTAILARERGNISDGVQKNEGSLVFNALSALAYELEKIYIQMDYIAEQAHAATADYEHLKLIASDRGLTPREATRAEVKAVANVEIPIGARVNLKAYNYIVTELMEAETHTYRLVCEETGSGPNELLGETTPIDFVDGLESCKITELLVAGEDYEAQEDFYKRYLESFSITSFAGNIAAYKEQLKAVAGIGGAKIYPVWNGGGTVKAVLLSSVYGSPSEYLVQQIQEKFCATPSMGYGMAPIGHDFTAAAVSEQKISVATSIKFDSGYSYEKLKDELEEKIRKYFLDLSKMWEDADNLIVYISKLESVILDVKGVVDITGTTLNGAGANFTLTADEIPVLEGLEVTELE